MCHIVTHHWSHRQAMARRSRNVLSQLLGRSTGEIIVPLGRRFGGRATKSESDRSRPNDRGSRRRPHPNLPDIERQHRRILAGPRRGLRQGAAHGRPQFHSRYRGTFCCTPRTR
jgi:hypothetical protein